MRPISRYCTTAVGAALLSALTSGPALAADTYTVQAGDSPWSIAATNGVKWSDLLRLNGLDTASVIHPGQQLVLRVPTPPSQTAAGAPAKTAAKTQGGLFSITITIPPPSQQRAKTAPAPAQAAPSAPPTPEQVRTLVQQTATRLGVDPALAVAVAQAESGLKADAVSPDGALGPLQVMPGNADWASSLAGRHLDLRSTSDSIEAGVAILRWLGQNTTGTDELIAAYRQGLSSVQADGIHADTAAYIAEVEQQMAAG